MLKNSNYSPIHFPPLAKGGEGGFGELINDVLVKSMKKHFFVIPVETGIQSFQIVTYVLDSRFRWNDDFLRVHH